MNSNNGAIAKTAIVLSAIALLLSVYILNNAPQETSELSKELGIARLEIQKQQREIERLAQDLKELDDNTGSVRFHHLLQKHKYTIDFTTPNVQDIGDGFWVSKASQEEHLDGIKFQGRIINSQSVTHLNLTFRLSVADLSKDFSVSRISSGNSTSFSVYIPDIKAKDARYAKIEYVGSSVQYLTR